MGIDRTLSAAFVIRTAPACIGDDAPELVGDGIRLREFRDGYIAERASAFPGDSRSP